MSLETDICIRDIQPSDRAYFLESVYMFYHSPAVCHEIPQRNADRTFDLLIKGTPYASCLIAEDGDGQPCGYCLLALTWSNEAGGLCVWLEEIMVSEVCRGKGIGKALISAAREKYKEAARFRLEVTENNKHAFSLYQKLGFTELPYQQMIMDVDNGSPVTD